MLDAETKRRIDTARDLLVGKVPDPKSQVEQITIALIYKFMDDIDAQSEELGGERSFFAGEFARYGWSNLMDPRLGGHETLDLYAEAIVRMPQNPGIPPLFRDIFNNAFLPYRDPETLREFLRVIDEFTYDNSERLGDAFEYLLSVLDSQGDAGQFRTPRHIIDFIVAVVDPKKEDAILDPACGTAGFLISSYKHILAATAGDDGRSALTPDDLEKLADNFTGYDISPDMVRLSLVNLYLHEFADPHIHEYDTLTSQDRWNEYADVILANPPFMSPKGGIRPHNRFSVKAKRSEVLFVDYMAEHLKPNGRAGIIVPDGIIFQSQTAYKQLRKMLVEEYLVVVVSLPSGVFQPYSGVKTSVLILDRELAKRADSIGFFKVENDGFDLGAQRRVIDKNDLPRVKEEIGEYLRRLRAAGKPVDDFQAEFGLVVKKERVAEDGEYNLSGERYRASVVTSTTWPMKTIGEVCDVINGSTPSKSEERFWKENKVSWFTVSDIRKIGRRITSTQQYVSQEALEETSLKLLPAKTVLICCTASVGEYAIAEIPLTTNQQFNGLVINNKFVELLDPEFLFAMASNFKDELIRLSGKTSFNFVSGRELKKLQIPLPPLEVQREIVAEIEGYQKVVDGARAVVDNYRPHIAVDPEWPMVALRDCCDFITDGTHYSPENAESGPRLYITSKNVRENYLDLSDVRYISERDHESIYRRCPVKKGDVLFVKDGVNAGLSALNTLSDEFSLLSSVAVLRGKANYLNNRFLSLFLNTTQGRTTMLSQTSGVAITRLTLTKINQAKIPVPPIQHQSQIIDEISSEQAIVDANRELIQRFEKKIEAAVGRVWGAGCLNCDSCDSNDLCD